MDIETGKLKINFVSKNQPVNLTDATVLLGFYFENGGSKIVDSQDGSVVIEDAQQGRCHVIMPSYKFDYSGPVLIHVYILYASGKRLDCATVATEFEKSWLDEQLPEMETYYVKRIEDWLADVEIETNKIKGELVSRLNELRQEIIITQQNVQHIQDQIQANNIVTQEEFNNLPIRQRIQVRDWNVLNPLELGLHHGEIALVYSDIDAMNQPFASDSSWAWAGSVMLVNAIRERFFLELFRSAPSVNDTNAYACRYFDNGAWETTWHRRTLLSQTVPLPNANIAQIGTANRAARADHVHPSDPTRLPLTGGALTGDLRMASTKSVIVENTVYNATASVQLNWLNNIPRIRVEGSAGGGSGADFQIQGTSDRIRMTIGDNRTEVPGTFTAGGNITAPRFIGTADTADQLRAKNVTDWNLLGSVWQNTPSGGVANLHSSQLSSNGPGGSRYVQGLLLKYDESGGGNGLIIANDGVASANSPTLWMRKLRQGSWGNWVRLIDENRGTAVSATRLATPKTINDVAFDGSTNITVTANPTTTRLAVNTDLNTITTPGYYNCPSVAEATAMANTPMNEAFSLQVIRHGTNHSLACTQIFNTYLAGIGNFRRFARNRNGETWGDWFEIPMAMGTARTYDMSVTRANQLNTARTITLSGAVTGSASFDGSANINIVTSLSSSARQADELTILKQEVEELKATVAKLIAKE